ncbi:MAG: hypothetical protein ACYSYV_00180 [Planctomycetota bacterium]
MLTKDNHDEARQESLVESPACCPSADSGSSCCSPGSDGGRESWKVAVFLVVVVAAGAVLARSFLMKSDSTADQTQQAFATIAARENAEASSQPNAAADQGASVKTEPTLWGSQLDSLASLNKVAAEMDAVFILLSGENQPGGQTIINEIEQAAKKIQSRGNRISAFGLKESAPDYEQLAKQFSVPCVLAMVKGCGLSAVSAEITESKLLEAFVAASRPTLGCGPSGCGPSGCGPSGGN